MKKYIFTILLLTAITAYPVHAQEFEPSQQALGYMEDKGVAVDHATGILNYSIPLLEIKSGDCTLPIKLNYTGKGVPNAISSELLGPNWNLQAGGVVSRVVRGLPDDMGNGLIYLDYFGITPSQNDIYALEKDGENDIFTASFNGKNIPFIVNGSKYKVEPLIKTNVRIEAISTSSFSITQFKITDTDGTVYFFDKYESIGNVQYDNMYHKHKVNLQNISAWYLTHIKIANGNDIKLNYINENEIVYKGEYHNVFFSVNHVYSSPWITPFYDEQNNYELSREETNQEKKSSLKEYQTSAVLLKSIESSNHTINFEYEYDYWSSLPITLHLCNLKSISSIKNSTLEKRIDFYYGGKHQPIEKIIVLDSENKHLSSLSFSYYPFPESIEGYSIEKDHWGFMCYSDGTNDELYIPWYDVNRISSNRPQVADARSLKSITNEYGGRIEFEYESNRVFYPYAVEGQVYYGGIRIKELRFHDQNGSVERIYYKYPDGGRLLYMDCSSQDVINYGLSHPNIPQETVYRGQVNLIGNAYVNTGNNGMTYPCVQEIREGKGSSVYFFESGMNSNNATYSYPFWLVGLPKMSLEFDNENKLTSINTLEYSTDIIPFDKFISQTASYEYFIDRGTIEEILRNSRNELEYIYYSENILPRTNAQVPPYKHYSIQYGGQALLKRKRQYLVNGCTLSQKDIIQNINWNGFNIADYNTALLNDEEYCYDNPDNPNATRILHHQPNGDIIAKRYITPLEYTGTDETIKSMKQANVLPVISEQRLIQKKGTSAYLLMDEQVTVYDKLSNTESYPAVFMPVRVKKSQDLYPRKISVSPSPFVSQTMTCPETDYMETYKIHYASTDGIFTPREVVENEKRSLRVYTVDADKNILNVLPASSTTKEQIDAKNIIPENINDFINFDSCPFMVDFDCLFYIQGLHKFYNFTQTMDINKLPSGLRYLFTENMLEQYHITKNIVQHLHESNYSETISYATADNRRIAEDWLFYLFTDPAFQDNLEGLSITDLGSLRLFIQSFNALITEDSLAKYRLMHKKISVEDKNLILQVANEQAVTYQVFTLQKGTTKIQYKINEGGYQTEFLYSPEDNWNIRDFEIVAGANSKVTVNVDVFKNAGEWTEWDEPEQIAYVMIVPKNEAFTASCYDKSQKLRCKFNQNKEATFYQYDNAGRLTESYLMDESSGVSKKVLLQTFEYQNSDYNSTLK